MVGVGSGVVDRVLVGASGTAAGMEALEGDDAVRYDGWGRVRVSHLSVWPGR